MKADARTIHLDIESMRPPIRTLLFSTLYPSSVRPGHGVFVETRQRELMSRYPVQTKVVAPVPWFPFSSPRFGQYSLFAQTPAREQRNGLDVVHPRYPLIPKFGMTTAPVLMAMACIRPIRALIEEGFDFDVIDAHYYYPDGVAAAWLSRYFKKPLCITARGSDLNLISAYSLPRRMIRWASGQAQASIGVCAALIDILKSLKIADEKLHVLPNGVDLERFSPLDSSACRELLSIEGAPVLLSVGHLVESKGHDLLIKAMPVILQRYPKAQLLIVGDGSCRSELQALVTELALQPSVRLAGAQPNNELRRWYSAADVLVLASSREGWANVLLEAMACGTPVVATAVGGTPEVVTQPEAGALVYERSPAALAQGILKVLERQIKRDSVRQYAQGHGWGNTSALQYRLFAELKRSGPNR